MRRSRVVLAALATACSRQPATEAAPVDIAAAARAARETVGNYVAAPDRASQAVPTPSVAPAPAAPRPADAVAGPPSVTDNAQGAANVVRRYYALIEAHRYRDAWMLWDDGGRASGMNAAAFATGWARYAAYHAEVGAPGRVDAGAGQRYVTVPVTITGTLADKGRPFAMEGLVTLHRTADIDGATAAQKSWRISASGVRPRP